MIGVLIAEDEELTRGALAALLDLEPDIHVVAHVGDGATVVRAAVELRPDVVLLDLEMPVLDGVEAALEIRRHLDVPMALVTRHSRPGVLRRALTAGIQGFVPKSTSAARIASILRDLHSGARYIDPSVAALALTEAPCPLTPRELDVLRYARRGDTVEAMAVAIGLAPGTVRNYVSSAMAKLASRTRHEAARKAWEEGWI
ncbi:DNA-binding response regulator [Streptomyces sp. NPDC050504]|uniref:DNA-binding response regulator n=1 Tax=Streptomyces sp. NPDC050504 TaxID=3365618 RepID=UPI003788FAD1